MAYDYALEELVEDALIAYVRSGVPDSVRVYPGWSHEEVQFPAIVVAARSSEQIEAGIQWTDHRRLRVTLGIMVEASRENNETPRTVNRRLRSQVATLFATETAHEAINALGTVGVKFSSAQIERIERGNDGMVLTSTMDIDVLAQSVTQ